MSLNRVLYHYVFWQKNSCGLQGRRNVFEHNEDRFFEMDPQARLTRGKNYQRKSNLGLTSPILI